MVEEQQDADDIKQGIVQDLSRISYLGFISHLRRVNTPMDPTAKIIAPHRLHTSQWGIMCPCESPDGASIGLLKNMAIMCHITYDSSPAPIMNYLEELEMIKIHNVRNIDTPTKVFVNNNWVGIHQDTPTLFRALKLLKRNGLIDKYTSISWNIAEDELHLLTEAGRCTRPLYCYDNNKLLIESYLKTKFDWQDLISTSDKYGQPLATLFPGKSIKSIITILEKSQAPIEFLDVEETNTTLIAMDNTKLSPRHSHCEIHPSTILSVVTHNIPLANHNQAPRNIFSGAQGKQAIGCYATNYNDRIDTMSYVLNYPQKCLVNTRFCEYLNLNTLPNGENLIVAIATYTGYNMEDSIIMNKTSVERGMFNLTYFKNHVEKEEVNAKENEALVFMNPLSLPMEQIKWANYSNLDANGLPKLNTYIEEGDAIIGKAKVKSEMIEDPNLENNLFGARVKKEVYSDRSVIADKTVSGIVDRVFIYMDDENLKTCKIRFRKTRTPELGDKCCSRMAQKGVIGMLIPHENMPFTRDGIVPDIIINPHAIPSRMTVGHLLETLLGKIGALHGTCIDGTPFNNNDYTPLYDMLQNKYGMQRHGNEIMYNGMYGTQMETEIFIGPTFYERLKHMVSDKINYRQVNLRTIYNNKKETILKDAPVSAITRQPTKGRGNNGGLRIGEMEKDSILSHGMLGFLKESMMERSDKFEYILDNDDCSILNKKHGDLNVSKVATPFAFKQFVHEMIGMGIKPILYTNKNVAAAAGSDSDDSDDSGAEPAEAAA
jgi:DNA-directed RNA polymerase II subunit RPB2